MSDNQLVLVKRDSPVHEATSKLYRWDHSSRKYHIEFEASIAALANSVGCLYKNPLTSFRDPIQFAGTYQELQMLKLR